MKPGGSKYLFSTSIRVTIFCSLPFLANPHLTSAASPFPDFYYCYNEKIHLSVSTEMIAVCFNDTVSKQDRQALIIGDPVLKGISNEKFPSGLTLATVKEGLDGNSVLLAVERLNNLPEVKYSTPVFEFQNTKLILTDEFIVRFKPDTTEENIQFLNNENGVSVVSKSPYRHNRYILRVTNPKAANALEIANIYNENPQVEYTTPNFLVLGGYGSTYPDDTYFPQQWALNNTGQIPPPGGTLDADIDAPEGWDISTGRPDIVIAIIDSGVDIDHEDLAANIWHNPSEIPGNGIDDDNNGYVDDFYGWNFENSNNDPRGIIYHGTCCAGLAAAVTDNGKGVSGVCPRAKIMPLKIGSAHWIVAAAAGAIDYATANGADVLSCSWGDPYSYPDVNDAIINAKNNGRNGKGCVIICASMNDNAYVCYPAKYPQVIAVGATEANDARRSNSNFGPELDVVAPGSYLWTTDITGSAGANSGNTSYGDAAGNYYKGFGDTSAATPQVAGLAALILSVNPYLTSDEVQSVIQSTADDKGDPGWDKYYGWGRINIFNALVNMPTLTLNKIDDIADGDGVVPGSNITYTISYRNLPFGNPNYIWDVNDVNITDSLPDSVAFISASGPNSVYNPDTRTVTWNIGPLEPNESGFVTLTVKCVAGCDIITNSCRIEGTARDGNWIRWAQASENTPVLIASSPSPTCGELSDFLCSGDPCLNLTWCPGHFAADANGHEVYLGTNFNDVNDANNSWPIGGVYKGPRTISAYPIEANKIELGTTYYWRIDEVNDSNVWKGSVWSFTIDCNIIDNFNSYSISDAIYNIWKDYDQTGYNPVTRALIQSAENKYLGGPKYQSMEYWFQNSYSPYYSEVNATIGTGTNDLKIDPNWLGLGAEVLSLWFYGKATNDANKPMYITLADSDTPSHIKKVLYSDYGDMNDIRDPNWHQWTIPLEDFAGVNLAKVKTIVIGFGIKNQPSTNGRVWFENIGLYLNKRCFPGCWPVSDFDSDCVVDFYDFAILAQSWLTDPNQSNYNPVCNIAVPHDNIIDYKDLARFCDYWLWQAVGAAPMGDGFGELLCSPPPPGEVEQFDSTEQLQSAPESLKHRPQHTKEDIQKFIDLLEVLLKDERIKNTPAEDNLRKMIESLKKDL